MQRAIEVIAPIITLPPKESSSAQKYGPPAVIATPRTEADLATPICTAMNAPDEMPDTVVCYLDSTVALPIMAAYALASAAPRPLKRLYDRREALLARLTADYLSRTEGR